MKQDKTERSIVSEVTTETTRTTDGEDQVSLKNKSRVNPKIIIVIIILLLLSAVLAFIFLKRLPKQQTSPNLSQSDTAGQLTKKETAVLQGEPTNVMGAKDPLSIGFNNAEQAVAMSGDQSLFVWVAGNSLELAKRDKDGNVINITHITDGDITLPAITKTGNLISVAWVEKSRQSTTVKAVISSDLGENFSLPIELGKGSGVSLASNGDTVTAVWHDGEEKQPSKIMARKYNGSTWESASRVDTSGKSPLWPSIAQNGDSIFVAWRDNRNGPYSVWLRRSLDGGNAWQDEQQISMDVSGDPDVCAPDEENIYLAHHGKGKISLLWSQDKGANFKEIEESGNGYFAHLSCTDQRVGLAWESTTEDAKDENKKVGWAIYRKDGSRIDGGEVDDGKSSMTTIFLNETRAELIWVKTSTDPLKGTLRHQSITFD